MKDFDCAIGTNEQISHLPQNKEEIPRTVDLNLCQLVHYIL